MVRLLRIPLKFVPKCTINNKQSLVQTMASCLTGDKSVSEPIMAQFIDAYMRHSVLVILNNPDSKVHVAQMGPNRVLSVPGGIHVEPMNLSIRELSIKCLRPTLFYRRIKGYLHFLPFLSLRWRKYTETEKSSFWWNVHHWLHCKLSKWQLPVQPVMKISSKWRHFCFSV